MTQETYDFWADVYDDVYSYVREDIPFYVEEAGISSGPVLELGCGTGRVTIPVADSGVQITGLDFSSKMIEVARRKASSSEKIELLQGDMRDFSLGKKFSLVIIPFRGFLSLLTVEDQHRTLDCVKNHLLPGGRLIFNVFVPDINSMLQAPDTAYHFRDVLEPTSGNTLVVWNQTNYHEYHQIMDIRTIIEKIDSSGKVVDKAYKDYQLRYAFRWEIYHLLKSSGFDCIDLYGGFDKNIFDETSGEMVWDVKLSCD